MADQPSPRVLKVGVPASGQFPPGGKRFAVESRRRDAVKLRLAGASLVQIALRLAADPAVNSEGKAYPYGYGYREYLRGEPPPRESSLVRKANEDIKGAMGRIVEETDRDSERLRVLNEGRIETMIQAAMPKAMSGSERHIGRILEAVHLLADINGWKKQTAFVEHSGTVQLSAESPQPEYTPEFNSNLLRALSEAGMADESTLAELAATTIEPQPELTVAAPQPELVASSHHDVIDAEIIEVETPPPVETLNIHNIAFPDDDT